MKNYPVDYEKEELAYALTSYWNWTRPMDYSMTLNHMCPSIWNKYFHEVGPYCLGSVYQRKDKKNYDKIKQIIEDLTIKYVEKYKENPPKFYVTASDKSPTAISMIDSIEHAVYELIEYPPCPRSRGGSGIVTKNGSVFFQLRGRYGSDNRRDYKDEIREMHRNPYFISDCDCDEYDSTYAIAMFKVSTPIAEKIGDFIDRLKTNEIEVSDGFRYRYLSDSATNAGVPDDDPLKNRYIFNTIKMYYSPRRLTIGIKPDLTITKYAVDSLIKEIRDTWVKVDNHCKGCDYCEWISSDGESSSGEETSSD